MLTKRIIPCLDVKEGRVVKGTNFVGLRDAGDPVERAAAYDAEGADELVFLDITATFEERKAMLDVISKTAAKVFMPLTVGGGISMDADGTKNGYDIALTKAVSSAVNVPVIASGGAGKLEDFYDVLTEGGADAVLAASVFHYKTFTIKQVKEYLRSRGIEVRL